MVSIIIPCYNASQFIESNVSSLQAQTYMDWEAIYVNDGSKDKTLSLLQQYAEEDSRIKVYTQKKQGAAKARELGVSKANGSYITFLDVDDTFVSNTLENIICNNVLEADIIVSGFNIVKDNRIVKVKKIDFQELDSISYLKHVLCGRYGWELCAKIYKKELFNQPIEMPAEIRIGEDAAVFIQLVINAKNIVGYKKPLYNYIQFENSASHVRNQKYAEETIEAACFIERIVKSKNIYRKLQNEVNVMFLLFFSNSTRKGLLEKKHLLMQKVKEHITLCALLKMPYKKALYVLFVFFLPSFFRKYIK